MAIEHWDFDVIHSNLGFVVRHLMVSKVHGKFSAWRGSLEFDDQNPTAAKIAVEIDVASINTEQEQRDAHLRSGDFFEAEAHPKITFTSTAIAAAGDGKFKLTGDLSMRGVTKSVTLDVEYAGRIKHPQMGERAGFSAHGSINRKDWGVSYNQILEAGGLALSEKVDLVLEIEVVKKAG